MNFQLKISFHWKENMLFLQLQPFTLFQSNIQSQYIEIEHFKLHVDEKCFILQLFWYVMSELTKILIISWLALLFINNFAMQDRDPNPTHMSFCMDQSLIMQHSLFAEVFDFEPVSGKIGVEKEAKQEKVRKGIGRPKGEKNSKGKEKKVKFSPDSANHKMGHWSLEENKRYHWFMEVYCQHFICKEMRRLDKIFKTMATFIGTREAEQCRSHHQKIILLFLRRCHYQSEDCGIVQEDMIKNQIESPQLISGNELTNLSISRSVSTIPSFQQQAKIQNGPLNQKEFEFQQNLLDLLAEDYEHRFEFDNIDSFLL